MAVTINVAELVNALRLGSTPEETAEVTRLLAFASEVVMKHAPNAPTTIQNEGAIRIAAYEYDAPNAGRGAGFADRLRNSGALAILAPWRVHRAGSTAEAVAPAPAGLREIGIEAVTVNAASRWVRTNLPFPSTAVFGVQVAPPTGTPTGVELGLTADLPSSGVADGGDASAALGANRFALGADRAISADRAGGAVYFASTATGVHTVRMFEHAGA